MKYFLSDSARDFTPVYDFFLRTEHSLRKNIFLKSENFRSEKKSSPKIRTQFFPNGIAKKSPTKKNLRFPPKKKSDRKSWKSDENRSFRNPIGFWWFSENIVDFSRFSFFPGFSILILIENFLRYFSRKWWHTFFHENYFYVLFHFRGISKISSSKKNLLRPRKKRCSHLWIFIKNGTPAKFCELYKMRWFLDRSNHVVLV